MNPPALNSLELLGLLSARLVHNLSNQLVVITGNVCAAANPQSNPRDAAAALHAALTAANGAGQVMNEFAELRRTSADALGAMAVEDLKPFLDSWCASKTNWSASVAGSAHNQVLPLSNRIFLFALDAIAETSPISGGEILATVQPWELQMIIRQPSAFVIDWERVRAEMKPLHLAVVCEALSQIGAKPLSRMNHGMAETCFRIPVRV